MTHFLPDCPVGQFKCTTGGGCIQMNERCDGIDQCPDKSDEWNCLMITNSTKENNSSYLQVLSSNTTWYQVCSDEWNSTYSDLVCQSIGYGGSSVTEYNPLPAENAAEKYFKLKPSLQFGVNILSQLELTSNKCENLVSVQCQDFG